MPRRKSDRERKSVYVSAEAWKKLSDMADKRGLCTADLIREAIVEYLKKRTEG